MMRETGKKVVECEQKSMGEGAIKQESRARYKELKKKRENEVGREEK